MKKALLVLSVIFYLISDASFAYGETPSINEGGFILIEAASGEVLCEQNSDKQLYPASITKIMTAILALEMGRPEQVMTASQAAISDIGKDGSNIGIMAGEKMTMEQLLKALLISSANEAANIIAENLCETREEFVRLMNEKAAQLGATATNSANPCGYHDDNHYTTPADMAKIARYAMTNDKFREIVSTKTYQLEPTNKHNSWPLLATTNKLMQFDDGKEFTINGVKTGYTGPAGYTLVTSAVNSEGLELISVVMGLKEYGSQNRIRTFSKELLAYGFNNFERVTLLKADSVYKKVQVIDAKDDEELELLVEEKIDCILPKGYDKRKIRKSVDILDEIKAPVNEGDILGHIELIKDGVVIGKTNLLAAKSIEMKPQANVKEKVLNFISGPTFKSAATTAVLIVAAFLLLRITLRTISRRINSKKHMK